MIITIKGEPGVNIKFKYDEVIRVYGDPTRVSVGWDTEDLEGTKVLRLLLISFLFGLPVTVKVYYE